MEVVVGADFGADGLGDWEEQADGFVDPMNDEVARDAESGALEDALLAIKWKVVDVFVDEELGEQGGGGKSAEQWGEGCRGNDGWQVAGCLAAKNGANGALDEVFGRLDVELVGDFFSDAFVVVGVLFDEFGDDFGGVDGELVESGDARAVGAAFGFVMNGVFCGLLRFAPGGGGLIFSRCFGVEAFEEELELCVVDALAFCAEELAGQEVDLLLEKFDLAGELFVFPCLAFDDLFGRFDGWREAVCVPTTGFVVVYVEFFSPACSRSYHGRIFAPRRSMPSSKSWRASGASDRPGEPDAEAAGQEKVPVSRRLVSTQTPVRS